MTLLLRAVLGSQQSKWQITEISLISTVPTQAQSLSLSTSPTRIVHLLQMTYHYDPKFIVHIWIHSWCYTFFEFGCITFLALNFPTT